MIWEKIRGHAEQVEAFRRSARRGRLAHAYLFAGPDGVGKKRVAQSLAQCLLCQHFSETDLEACGECSSCRLMLAGTHPDFYLVGCPEGKSELPIETFVGPKERRGREGLCYELWLRPMAGRRKIAVIDDANLMNAASANALLKTLEEPPSYSLLILIAVNIDGILPTIRSRCQSVRFGPLDAADVADLLLELGRTDDRSEAETTALLSQGSLTVAGQLLDPRLRTLRDALFDALAADRFDAVATAKTMLTGIDEIGGDLVTQRRNAGWIVQFLVEFYREILRFCSGDGAAVVVPQARQFASRFDESSSDGIERIIQLIDRSVLAEQQLGRKTSVPICFEALFDDLGRTLRSAAIG